ncbi:MAG TPA: hypothetical protein DEQ06_08015 [Porphyromonadaceae bacterium]|nr:hypothetical protein [Porphyromonadaceae bacterium]
MFIFAIEIAEKKNKKTPQMIVFNTTFHVDAALHEEFVDYMLEVFIPIATRSGLLTSPRLSRVFGEEGEEGYSYAMEFTAADLATLEQWNNEESNRVVTPLLEKFREKVAGFSTVMQTISY